MRLSSATCASSSRARERIKSLFWYTGAMQIEPGKVTTAFELDGYKVAKNLGIVRGIVVRSRSIVGSIGAGL